MNKRSIWSAAIAVAASAVIWIASPDAALAQGKGPAPAPPKPPRQAAPIDLTGTWVSLVTEDWLYRMVTPAKGDVASVPVSQAARTAANAWDPAKDEAEGNQCKSYGAPAIMRVPGRVRISWQDDDTLKIETDAGQQTRLLHFGNAAAPAGDLGWQGWSASAWEMAGGRGPQAGFASDPRGASARGGSLKVTTTRAKAGYLRKNGIPYSANAVVTEYYDRLAEPNGDSLLIVKTMVDDPANLTGTFITSTHFKKLPDNQGWNPTACAAR